MRLTPFWRSHCPLNGLQPVFLFLILLVLCQGQCKHKNVIWYLNLKIIYHIGHGQGPWQHSQFTKTI